MSSRKLTTVYLVLLVGVSLPFVVVHLLAHPDDAPISPVQHATAALANYFGPWAGPIVRLVDFPNAGLESFRLGWAVCLSLIAAALVIVPILWRKRVVQYAFIAFYAAFLVVWFGTGFFQIAAGLL